MKLFSTTVPAKQWMCKAKICYCPFKEEKAQGVIDAQNASSLQTKFGSFDYFQSISKMGALAQNPLWFAEAHVEM